MVRNENLSNLVGGKLYLGYGLTENDMLANGKYRVIYVVGDTTAPTVTNTIHLNGATNVAINTKIGATFSEEMDPLTINTATFILKKGTTVVPGTVAYTGVSAVFSPTVNLDSNTTYTVTVTTGARDLSGNPLAKDFVISWKTAAAPDTTAPKVISTINANGATGVAANTKIGATFNEGMDPLTINNTTFTFKQGGDTAVPGEVSYSGVTALFTPKGNLSVGSTYVGTITTGAKDLAGNPLASNYVWSWTVVPGIDFFPPLDTSPPSVGITAQVNGATNVPIDTTVGATFSEGMDPLRMTNVNFTLKETVSGTAVAGTVSYSGVNAVFTPLANLAPNLSHTATIKGGASGVRDLAGNVMTTDFVWAWTTGATPVAVVPLATAANFAILTKAAITDVPASAITGDVGASPITAASIHVICTEMSSGSKIYGVDAAFTTDPVCYNGLAADKTYVDTAVGDMGTAYTNAAGRAAGTGAFLNVGAGNIGGQTLVPGVYTFNGAGVTIPTDVTLSGGPNDVWIFQIAGTLDIAANKKVLLSGGAQAKNIFWQVAGTVTLLAGAHFEGTILAQTNIQLVTGATINGRLLAQTDVALDHNTVVKPAP